MNDYDAQRKVGIDVPVFNAADFPELNLDRTAWKETKQSHHDRCGEAATSYR